MNFNTNMMDTTEENTATGRIDLRDERTLRRVFDRHFPRIRDFAARLLGDGMLADDMAQEAFLYVWQKQPVLLGEDALKSYLYHCVKNKCLNYLRDQVAERRADPNRLFYEQLWTLVEPFVKQLENVGFRPSESDFASVGFGSVSDFLHRLRDALRRGGLEVVCSPEECVAGTDEEDCFVVSRDAGFATPAIVRRSDGYVFVKGVRPAD